MNSDEKLSEETNSTEENNPELYQILRNLVESNSDKEGPFYNVYATGLDAALESPLSDLTCTMDFSIAKPAFKVRDQFFLFPKGSFIKISLMNVGLETLVKQFTTGIVKKRPNLEKDSNGKIEKLLDKHVFFDSDKSVIIKFMKGLGKVMSSSYSKDHKEKKIKKQGATLSHLAHIAILTILSEVFDQSYSRKINPFNNVEKLIVDLKDGVSLYLSEILGHPLSKEANKILKIANNILVPLVKLLDGKYLAKGEKLLSVADIEKTKQSSVNIISQVALYRKSLDEMVNSISGKIDIEIEKIQEKKSKELVSTKFFKEPQANDKSSPHQTELGNHLGVLKELTTVQVQYQEHTYIRQLLLMDIIAKLDGKANSSIADLVDSARESLHKMGVVLIADSEGDYKKQFEGKVIELNNLKANPKTLIVLSDAIDEKLNSGVNPFKDMDYLNELLENLQNNRRAFVY